MAADCVAISGAAEPDLADWFEGRIRRQEAVAERLGQAAGEVFPGAELLAEGNKQTTFDHQLEKEVSDL